MADREPGLGLMIELLWGLANGIFIGGILSYAGEKFFTGLLANVPGLPITADSIAQFMFGIGVVIGVWYKYRDWFIRKTMRTQ